MQALFSTLELVAPMNSTVLIQGETGTGKELIARTIHHNSPRPDQRFVAFNAAAIPERPGRGRALRPREGRLHRRDRQRVPAASSWRTRARSSSTRSRRCRCALQAKLLRALQEREVERVGDSQARSSSTSASSPPPTRDLRTLVKAGTFREDLFYRLNVDPGQAAAAARARARTFRCWRSTS